MQEKKRCRFRMYILIIVFGALLAITVSAQTPQPRNVEGRVFTNASNGVQNDVPVRINSTTSKDSVLTYTNGIESIPELRGVYSLTLNATNNEVIVGWAWNATFYGTNTTTIQGGTTNLNFVLNISRPSEANVTILMPQNNTLFNKSRRFNVTANISIIGNDATSCNATIKFYANTTMNITADDNLTRFLGDIPRGGHRIVNWSVVGLDVGSANLSVRADCASDGIKLEKVNVAYKYNLSFQNLGPQITRVAINSPVDLTAGSNLTLFCNATIFDANTPSDLAIVNATIFQQSIGHLALDDNNYHYTNSTCQNFSSSTTEANYSCRFNVAYYANNGTWKCNITAADFGNVTNQSNATFIVNELLAIDVIPSVIDYGSLRVTNVSQTDVNITVRNAGNMMINASVRGFAPNESLAYLNLSMNCPIGNITNDDQRFSVNNGTPFANMDRMNNISRTLNFTLWQRTNDVTYGNDTNSTFWKIRIPLLTLGSCNGTVIFKAIPI